MIIRVNDKDYEVIVTRKRGQRNTYLRVKEDLKVHVTTNTFTPMFEIERFIKESQKAILKMINTMEKRVDNNSKFLFLGREYDVIYTSTPGISLGEKKVFMSKDVDEEYLDKWYKKEATKLFEEHLELCYNNFSRKIPHPSALTIRKMSSRWGVCNTKTHRITLNLNLIKKPIYCLDYVIMHELSHLIYADHSREFWNLVEENCEQYKQIKKILKE